MASNKLLSVTFTSLGGGISYNLACNSSDNIPESYLQGGHPFWSNDTPLYQTGGLVVGGSSNDWTWSRMGAIFKVMVKNGYGTENGGRVLLPKNSTWENVKCYLNGKQYDDDGNPMPYVVWEQIGFADAELVYHMGDGTSLGRLVPTTYGSNDGIYCGKLYDDGTFIGDIVGWLIPKSKIRPGTWTPPYSSRYYGWGGVGEKHPTRYQLISPAIINDLADYLPFEPEGSYVDEGGGDFDANSDPVDFPGLPGVSILDTGLLKMFQMNTTQVHDLADYLWSGLFDLDTFKKLFSDPMEAILNLSIMPINEATTTPTTIRIGNITTNVSGLPVNNQYKIIDFGTINMNEFWASYADYSPYTRLSIFLPYVGVQAMSIDDVMNGNIQLKAYVDLLTGSVQYILKSNQTNRAGHGHNSVLYTWGGNCQYQIPLTASNMSQVISSITGTVSTIAGGVAATVATGGLTAPLAVGMAAGSISNAMSAKTHVQRGGGIGGSVGIFGVQTPYLILERPEQVYPENYEATKGSPSMQTRPLGYYSGYVRVEAVNLSIPGATEAELKDIEAKLKGGVIV